MWNPLPDPLSESRVSSQILISGSVGSFSRPDSTPATTTAWRSDMGNGAILTGNPRKLRVGSGM